jgi:molecular chaperone DnaJ
LRYDVELTLEDVLRGVERQITYSRLAQCSSCRGTGSAGAQAATQCPDCRGQGQVRSVRQTPIGQFMATTTCSRCGGAGSIIANPCKTCRGTGRREERQQVHLKIPAGVEDGTRVRYHGLGEAGERGGAYGDLYVYIIVAPHDVFKREGPNLRCETAVSFTQAALGAKLELEALDGAATIDIPAGTQNGSSFRISGRGLPRARGAGRGDLIVDVHVRVPTKLTRKQRELLEEFARAGGEELDAGKGLLKRFKEAFGGE